MKKSLLAIEILAKSDLPSSSLSGSQWVSSTHGIVHVEGFPLEIEGHYCNEQKQETDM